MKFSQTVFCHELLAVITGSVLAVATVAFLTLPYSLAARTVMSHLT